MPYLASVLGEGGGARDTGHGLPHKYSQVPAHVLLQVRVYSQLVFRAQDGNLLLLESIDEPIATMRSAAGACRAASGPPA